MSGQIGGNRFQGTHVVESDPALMGTASVQCFCFEEQRLRADEKVDMPVFFYIDPEFATDVRMRGIENITLSYTFFKVAEDNGDDDEVVQETVGGVVPVQAATTATQ
ncbi:hypothetical protein KSW81_008025 [Nannochloris sp. 'desiccata']|nr:hypothetical protein KSW81_008025 [Chlorella desiccata (nom. nud.)]